MPNRPPIRTMAFVVALAAASGGTLVGQSAYKDTALGFTLPTIKDWGQIPVQPTEKTVVAKWDAPRPIRELPAGVRVYVFDKRAKSKLPPGFEDLPAAAGGYERTGGDGDDNPFAPIRSFKQYAKREKMTLKNEKSFKPKTVPARPATGTLYEVVEPSGYRLGSMDLGNYIHVIGVVETDDLEFAVDAFVSEKEFDKWKAPFQSLARGFTLLEREAPAAAAPTEGTLTPREEARRIARENVAKVKGWWFDETENYLIVTNVKKEKSLFMKELKDRLEAIRKVYERDFPPAQPIDAVSIVRVCDSEDTYHKYGGPGGSAGYWAAFQKELVLYFEGQIANTWSVLMHEAFHQYIYYACGEISPHSWFNEGYGDYYSGAQVQGTRVLDIGPFLWRRDLIKSKCREGSHVPLPEFIRYTQGQYYQRADLCYAQGWSLIYFLNKGLPDGHPWGTILTTYLKVLQETKEADQAVQAAFKDVDLAKLEAAWIEFTTKGTKVAK